MNKEKFLFDETKLANIVRDEVIKNSQNLVGNFFITKSMDELEMISENKKEEFVSPIFTMSEDEILNFVEEFDVNELATLSVAELNHIGKVLGVDPTILVEGED